MVLKLINANVASLSHTFYVIYHMLFTGTVVNTRQVAALCRYHHRATLIKKKMKITKFSLFG